MQIKFFTKLLTAFLLFTIFVYNADANCPTLNNNDGNCISVGNHYLFTQQKGESGPIIVFESGRGDTHEIWDDVVNKAALFSRTFTYDRTGLGNSQTDPKRSGAITAHYVAQNLKILLANAHLPPPYILVGHSSGGSYVQMFARLYPKLTAAVILVDSVSQNQTISDTLPPKNDPVYQEALGFEINKQQLQNAPPFPAVPLVVLTASYHGSKDPQTKLHLLLDGKPATITAGEDQVLWDKLQDQLAALSPISTHLYVYDSDHYIQKMQPEAVVNALYTLVKQNKANSLSSMNKILAQFANYAEQTRKDWQVPGMAVAIVQGDQIIYAQGFGERNAQGAPVTPDTIFDIASLTKSFTAALLAMQIDEGKYNWGTKITILYPGFKLYDANTTKEFAVRDLLAHNSGLPEDATDLASGNFGYSIHHTIYALRFIKPVAPFRTEFAYQDIFPMLAGEIIQNISGASYADYLHQQLFKPLQMNNSYVDSEEKLNQLDNVAQRFANFAGKHYPYPKNPVYLSKLRAAEQDAGGSGGIHSSATDIAKWLLFNMNNGAVGNRQLISAQNMNFIHSPQTVIKTSSRDINLNGDTEQAYGEGWFIDKQEYRPYTVLYHAGGGTGMHALMAYIPEQKIGIVILTNTWGNKVPEALYQRFFDLYFNKQPLRDWSKEYLQQKTSTTENVNVKPAQCQIIKNPDLDKYVGTYYNPVYGDLAMSKQDDHLLLNIGPIGITWQLTLCQNNIFKAYEPNPYGMVFPMLPSGQDLIEFKTGKNNTIQQMTIPFLNGDGSGIFIKK